jgi:hypothetical protein
MGGRPMKNVVTSSIVTITATLLATIMVPATYAGSRNKERRANTAPAKM